MGLLDGRATLRNAEATRMAQVLAERLADVVPKRYAEVSAVGGLLSVVGVGRLRSSTLRMRLAYVWLLPLPVDTRLTLILTDYCTGLQEFLTKLQGSPWPGINADTHVDVSNGVAHVWWGSPNPKEAVASLRPISHDEFRAHGKA